MAKYDLKGQCREIFTSVFNESYSSWSLIILLALFQIFQIIREDLRNSGCTNGDNDTIVVHPKNVSEESFFHILFGPYWVAADIDFFYNKYSIIDGANLKIVGKVVYFSVGVNDFGGQFPEPTASVTTVVHLELQIFYQMFENI